MEQQATVSLWFYLGFTSFILMMLALDLGVFHRRGRVVGIREALAWSGFWVGLALIFGLAVMRWFGAERGLEFFTGYAIELSLSVDNVFIFLVIFAYFSVPREHQHRVLFYGILGAIVMRAGFIATGVALLAAFHWLIYGFGAFLIVTGIRIGLKSETGVDPQKNLLVRLVRRMFPVSDRYHGQRFFLRSSGRLVATPLVLVLVAVEATDLVFAVDSVPAILAITDEPFIVYTSNIFAVLGLRSFFFLLSGVIGHLRYLRIGLAIVLVFVGIKMTTGSIVAIPVTASLGTVIFVILLSVLASLVANALEGRRDEKRVARAASGGDTAPCTTAAGRD